MSDHQDEIKVEDNKEKKQPKRYSLYDQININEEYLNYFIVGTIILLAVIVFVGVV